MRFDSTGLRDEAPGLEGAFGRRPGRAELRDQPDPAVEVAERGPDLDGKGDPVNVRDHGKTSARLVLIRLPG